MLDVRWTWASGKASVASMACNQFCLDSIWWAFHQTESIWQPLKCSNAQKPALIAHQQDIKRAAWCEIILVFLHMRIAQMACNQLCFNSIWWAFHQTESIWQPIKCKKACFDCSPTSSQEDCLMWDQLSVLAKWGLLQWHAINFASMAFDEAFH